MEIYEYNRCVDRFSDRIYGYILKQIRDEDLAKDMVQEAYIKLWNKVEVIHEDAARSFLYKAAYHSMIDWIRRNKYQVALNNQPHPEVHQPSTDLKELLDQALDTLPDIQKSIVLLRDFEGYSYKEIGEILELSESQVKVYLYRARIALRKYIGKLEIVL
jgi:RNA polymerase sigma factor (sigma-70 family)